VESDETNNGLTAAGSIDVFRPDLVVPLVTAPTVWSTGQPFTVTARVRNQGLPPAAAGAFRVGAYLSTLLDPGSGVLVGSVAVTSLNPQTNASVTIPVAVPTFIAPGSYFVSVVADYEQRVTESNEGNNGLTAAQPVDIRRADLSVAVLTPPATGSIGKTIAVANTVSNAGTATAIAVRVSFFVSPVSPTPGQGRLIGTRDIASLPAGASSAVTTTLTLPANLEPGSYFVSAVVDVAGAIVEGEEGNNGRTADGQILVGL
jgi:serralysin